MIKLSILNIVCHTFQNTLGYFHNCIGNTILISIFFNILGYLVLFLKQKDFDSCLVSSIDCVNYTSSPFLYMHMQIYRLEEEGSLASEIQTKWGF